MHVLAIEQIPIAKRRHNRTIIHIILHQEIWGRKGEIRAYFLKYFGIFVALQGNVKRIFVVFIIQVVFISVFRQSDLLFVYFHIRYI